MRPMRVLAVASVFAMLAWSVLPAQALVPVAAPALGAALPDAGAVQRADGYVAWYASDHTYGVMTKEAFAQREVADKVVECKGVSPNENGCTLTNNGCGSWIPRFCAWIVGWDVPPPVDPVGLTGAYVGSTHVVMTGTYDAQGVLEFACNWAAVSPLGFQGPPFVGASCTTLRYEGQLAGTLTAVYTNGAYNLHTLPFVGSALPDTSGAAPAVGSWDAKLLANFAG